MTGRQLDGSATKCDDVWWRKWTFSKQQTSTACLDEARTNWNINWKSVCYARVSVCFESSRAFILLSLSLEKDDIESAGCEPQLFFRIKGCFCFICHCRIFSRKSVSSVCGSPRCTGKSISIPVNLNDKRTVLGVVFWNYLWSQWTLLSSEYCTNIDIFKI